MRSAWSTVERRWAMRIVIASRLWLTSRIVLADLVLGDRVERRGRLVEDEQVGVAQQGARDREALALAARDLHACFSDDRVQSLVRPREQAVARRASQRVQHLRVARSGAHEQQVLANAPREQLRVLRDEPDAGAQSLQVHLQPRVPVVENPARLRAVEAHQQLHERALARARRPHEGDRPAAATPRRRCLSAPQPARSGA